jgi:(2R)-3-sulfolactate dehydrogenase (NADP+)
VIGTNPMSFAVPGPKGKIAFLIDQSSSAVAWSTVKHAADEGREIPLGWALDKNGRPTTDPKAGLEGTMAPSGGYKGFGQGLIVEVMCAAMTGALLGTEMGALSGNDGKHVDNGQFFMALDPKRFSGGAFDGTIKRLSKSILAQEGARLPNSRRLASQKRLAKEGLRVDKALYERLLAFA